MVDKECPYIKFFFWDALVSSHGGYECIKNVYYDEYGGPNGYEKCEQENHFECSIYKNNLEKEGKEKEGWDEFWRKVHAATHRDLMKGNSLYRKIYENLTKKKGEKKNGRKNS